ncbi:MBOAT family O-acyltransferase [Oribacterium sp. P6A1]|uniref:MBOAT family O-acyltransferase n=1 Tax=Oribacterium sp. P6A1 TaxID=1410612 RepID=UPI0006904566|nr:MBOAT family O-acyltransferase [Oribacterium sp. P6A1]
MSFTSLFFVAIFFPVFLLVYYVLQGIRARNAWLLAASLVFYAFLGINCLILIVIMAVFAFATGKKIQSALDMADSESPDHQTGDEEFMSPEAQAAYEKNHKSARIWLFAGVFIFVAVLMLFKYSNFWLNKFNLSSLGGIKEGIIRLGMPLGISFYTFKLISYISDVYMRRVKAGSLLDVMLYTVIFHQVTQGPIVRYDLMASQFNNRSLTYESVSEGVWRFSIGLAKKTFLADHCGELAELFLPVSGSGEYSVLGAYMGSLCYMLQIYLDFSAYSDMALGLGQMIGFKYTENFNYPYVADTVRDFWRRWHISLSSFFRDYVYIPLGGSRVGFFRLLLNLLAVWLLTGIWHGASLNFILWGLYYYFFIVMENAFRKYGKSKGIKVEKNGFTTFFSHIYTLIIVYFGWILFRITDFGKLWEVLRVMIGRSGRAFYSTSEILSLRGNIYFLILALSACTPVWKMLAIKISERLNHSFRREVREMRNLAKESSLYEQEVNKDQVLVEKYAENSSDILEEVRKQDTENHERMIARFEKRLRKRKDERTKLEFVYYGVRIILMLVLLFISILSMVGASYTPFLYNQF